MFAIARALVAVPNINRTDKHNSQTRVQSELVGSTHATNPFGKVRHACVCVLLSKGTNATIER